MKKKATKRTVRELVADNEALREKLAGAQNEVRLEKSINESLHRELQASKRLSEALELVTIDFARKYSNCEKRAQNLQDALNKNGPPF